MSLREWLILASFVAGIVPVVILTAMYGWRGNWRSSSTGRAIFYLFLVFVAWTGISIVTLVWPEQMKGETGEWVRIVSRLVMDVVLWNVLRVFLRAQRRTADPNTPKAGISMPADP